MGNRLQGKVAIITGATGGIGEATARRFVAEGATKLQTHLAHATLTPRSVVADDIANAALFLARDDGSFVNCHDPVVDGGRIWQFNERPREA